jgi:two-component system chemotaxis sensor kinase CheA
MSIDFSEFHDVFFEECFEGLDVMESGLLTLDHGTNVEEIDSIFRAAHSIKGGGASFGFMEISGFTHVMETLLDEMRECTRSVTREAVNLLLESVDVLRLMVDAAKDDQKIDPQRTGEVRQKLETMLAEKESATNDQPTNAGVQGEEATTGPDKDGDSLGNTGAWRITFAPHAEIMLSGNEPTRIFRELQSMGTLNVEIDASRLPPLDQINPEHCYLQWILNFSGYVSEEEVHEVFSWIAADSELEIVSVANGDSCDVNEDIRANAQPPKNTAIEQSAAQPDDFQEEVSEQLCAGSAPKASGNIRVSIDKVDELINMVGELVITQSMLTEIGTHLDKGDQKTPERLRAGIAQLGRNTRELQESVLQIRMLPVSFSFSRFPRLVHDISSNMGKNIELKMEGEKTEVDKTVLEKIGDPLVHLVRNALDHGIEMPEVRKAAGKHEVGTVELRAYHEGGDIIIKVIDDGAGLNRERILSKAIEKGLIDKGDELSDDQIFNLIFAPGFSTAEKVSDVSGRGVGMDVVRRNVSDLGGNVTISSSEGIGSTVTIRLPLTLAILDGQLVCIGEETYIVSLVSIVESLQMKPEQISSVAGESELYYLRDEYIPIIRVDNLFGGGSSRSELKNGLLMVVESDGKRFGLFVDELLGQQQVVIKSLETNFRQVHGISGATILGDGTVALIIDVPGLIQRHLNDCKRSELTFSSVA